MESMGHQGELLGPEGSSVCILPGQCGAVRSRERSGKAGAAVESVPRMFYAGIGLSWIAAFAFITGATSSHWVHVDVGATQISKLDSHFALVRRHRLLARLGPWSACDRGGHCDSPWVTAPGLDAHSVRGVQALVVLTSLTYIAAFVVTVLQLFSPGVVKRRWPTFTTAAVPECLFPVAAVLGLLSLLLMGQLKRRLLLKLDQSTHPGWGFIICLCAVLLTVGGSLCQVVYRPMRDPMAYRRYSQLSGLPRRMRPGVSRARRKGRGLSRGDQPPALTESDIRVSVVSFSHRDRGCDIESDATRKDDHHDAVQVVRGDAKDGICDSAVHEVTGDMAHGAAPGVKPDKGNSGSDETNISGSGDDSSNREDTLDRKGHTNREDSIELHAMAGSPNNQEEHGYDSKQSDHFQTRHAYDSRMARPRPRPSLRNGSESGTTSILGDCVVLQKPGHSFLPTTTSGNGQVKEHDRRDCDILDTAAVHSNS